MNTRRKKRPLTLLEIMIVIVLIGLIGSVIGFNMKTSLDEGRAFKTEKAQEKIRDILMLEVARGCSLEQVVKDKEIYLRDSGLANNVKTLLKDGWGDDFDVRVDTDTYGDIIVFSKRLEEYRSKKQAK